MESGSFEQHMPFRVPAVVPKAQKSAIASGLEDLHQVALAAYLGVQLLEDLKNAVGLNFLGRLCFWGRYRRGVLKDRALHKPYTPGI